MAEANVIQCPNCGQAYFVQPHQWGQYQGQTINCTRCGRPFTVTSAAPAQASGAPGTEVESGAAPGMGDAPAQGVGQSPPQIPPAQVQSGAPQPQLMPPGYPPSQYHPGAYPPPHYQPYGGTMY